MKGSYRVIVQNNKVRYDFRIRRNITILQGDSATGKTTLIEMIEEYDRDAEGSGIFLSCEKECVVLAGRRWETALKSIHGSLVFIDEDNAFIRSEAFAKAVQNSDNYYIIASRYPLYNLPYSIEEIYGIRNAGKYAGLKQIYNEFFHLYGAVTWQQRIRPGEILTEDSNAGYEFFKALTEKTAVKMSSSGGKTLLYERARQVVESSETILVIADGAAFGAEMGKMMSLVREKPNLVLYLPESFEWIILSSGIIKDGEIPVVLQDPSAYIPSEEYFSWERFFTALLIQKTAQSYLRYSKASLNPVYKQEEIKRKILDFLDRIDFS